MNARSNILRLAIFALLLAPLGVASPALAEDFIQAGAFFFDGDPNVQTKSIKGGRAGASEFSARSGKGYLQSDKEPCTLIIFRGTSTDTNESGGLFLLIDFLKAT
jgi:hypothetical protein